jgi:hypothetical protein
MIPIADAIHRGAPHVSPSSLGLDCRQSLFHRNYSVKKEVALPLDEATSRVVKADGQVLPVSRGRRERVKTCLRTKQWTLTPHLWTPFCPLRRVLSLSHPCVPMPSVPTPGHAAMAPTFKPSLPAMRYVLGGKRVSTCPSSSPAAIISLSHAAGTCSSSMCRTRTPPVALSHSLGAGVLGARRRRSCQRDQRLPFEHPWLRASASTSMRV